MQDLNLNLLPVLERLIATQSVTASARDLGLSVPAVSRALGRLRRHYHDELLVRSGRRMVLTPRAEALYPSLKDCLRQISELSEAPDPANILSVKRSFRVRCDDVFAGLLSSALFKTLHESAPGLSVALISDALSSAEDLRTGVVDMEVGGRPNFPIETIVKSLGKQQLVGLVKKDHPLLDDRITPRRFVSFPHVLATVQLDYEKEMQTALAPHRLSRDARFVVPSFYAAGLAASQSLVVATMPEVMARQLEVTLKLRRFAIPLSIKSIPVSVAWHAKFADDFAHRWLRECVAKLATDVLQNE